MANQEHLALFKQGAEVWNQWRQDQRNIRPDLSGADLRFFFNQNESGRANWGPEPRHRAFDPRGAGARMVLDEDWRKDWENPPTNFDFQGADLCFITLDQSDLSGAWCIDADLCGASLIETTLTQTRFYKADLSFADLRRANLSFATLSMADLRGANLRGASLTNANLKDAHLISTNLVNANLSRANLCYANLHNADLSLANLSGAELDETILGGVHLGGTVFANNDLRTTKGLHEIIHQGRSYIALQTVQLPQDESALHFLRGTGVSNEWIDVYWAQMIRPIQYHSCFISYSSKDDPLARRLYADLQEQGVRCWFAPEDLKIGDKWRARIDEAIHLQDKLLLLLSENALTSSWVEDEVEAALEKERRQHREVLFPIRLDDQVMHSSLAWAAKLRRTRHIGDFTRWTEPQVYQQAFERLLRDLKADIENDDREERENDGKPTAS